MTAGSVPFIESICYFYAIRPVNIMKISDVIFPVTPEIQKRLNKYAYEPKLGQRVLSIMSQFITPKKEIWMIQRYNKYIRKHMEKVAELLGMEQKPLPTRACDSFATNLNNSGRVPLNI